MEGDSEKIAVRSTPSVPTPERLAIALPLGTRLRGGSDPRSIACSRTYVSIHSTSSTFARSCSYLSQMPNRNISGVNQTAFRPVQLTGGRRRLAVGLLQLTARGEFQVVVGEPRRDPKKVASRTGRSIVLVMLVLLLAVASFSWDDLGSHRKLYWLVRGLAGVLAAVCAYLYMRTSESVRTLDSPQEPQGTIGLIPLTDWQLQRLKINASSAIFMGFAEAQIFALATTYPAALRQRVSERYVPLRRTVRHTVSMAINIPADKFEFTSALSPRDVESDIRQASAANRPDGQIFSFPIPAVLFPKGELNDELIIYGNGDEVLPAYSYSEYLQLAARVLHVLLTNAFYISTNDSESNRRASVVPGELEPSLQAAEDAALRCIMHRGRINEDEVISAVKGISSLQQRIPLPADLSEDLLEERWQARILVQLAAKFVEKLSYDYAIVVPAECRSNGRINLRYERLIIPTVKLSEQSPGSRNASIIWFVRWSKDRLRFLLGTRPVELTVPLENATTCQSFHMTVVCPEGLYLREQLVPRVNEYLRHNARPTNVPPYCRLRRRLGQPYAHFYSRFFPEPKKPEHRQSANPETAGEAHGDLPSQLPFLKVRFYEVPPASMFRAALVSIGTTLPIWLVGLIVSHVPNEAPRTDAPVLIFALPTVIGAWMIINAPGRQLFEGTLGARLSLIYSALCAIAATGLFLIYDAQLGMLHGVFDYKFSVLGVDQISWGTLVTLSALNTFYACYFSLLRTWEFTHLSARSISGNSTYPEGGYVQY